MFISCFFNNPSLPSALVVSAFVILLWTTLFVVSVRGIRRDPKPPLKFVLIGVASLLVLAAPFLIYLLVTIFVLIDFK